MDISILGTRGIPAQHGGFETFAENLARFLVGKGHTVTVYCQVDHADEQREDVWRGVKRVLMYAPRGPIGTMIFDWKAALHAYRRPALILTLGYNTALLSLIYRLSGRTSLMNMDGIEWARDKWSRPQRAWLRANEYLGSVLSTHLIADHPEIAKHLERKAPASKIAVIPYGAPRIQTADSEHLSAIHCHPYEYGICISRPEPENSTLEIVRAFSTVPRSYRLVVLGKLEPEVNMYHKKVMESASEQVIFPGAIYEKQKVQAFRFFAKFYVHGHRVGGTNPSLVEAMGCGNAVIAHRNRFNRWVAGQHAAYFDNEKDLAEIFSELAGDEARLAKMREASLLRHQELFMLEDTHEAYEALFQRFI